MLAAHMDYPNGFAASEQKKEAATKPVYRPRLTSHLVFTTKPKMFSSQRYPGAKGLLLTRRADF